MSRVFWVAACEPSKVKSIQDNALNILEKCKNVVKVITMRGNLEKIIFNI